MSWSVFPLKQQGNATGQDRQGHYCRHGQSANHRISHKAPEYLRGDRDHAEDSGAGGQQNRPGPVHRGVHYSLGRGLAEPHVDVDLLDQDDRVAHDHAH